MKTVGIIAEYNPFHAGHAYHIQRIREEFGTDTRIVAVMSGNFPQRGGIAIADKYTRAAAAVAGGVDLVLELPFPFSGETAPVFARAGVAVLHALGAVDILSFGSECGDISLLIEATELTATNGFHEAAHEAARHASIGYPAVYEALCRKHFKDAVASILLSPNNLLGIEYIRAAKALGASFALHTVQRIGAAHDSVDKTDLPSAYAIRAEIKGGGIEQALSRLPQAVSKLYRSAITEGLFPTFDETLSSVVLSYFCLNSPQNGVDIADAGGGLYSRIFRMAKKACNTETLISLTATKKYTEARIRRAIRNVMLGVTSSDITAEPCYIPLLSMNERGQQLLHDIRRTCALPILTKPADYKALPEQAYRQAAAQNRADSLYTLAFPQIRSRDYFLRHSPVRIETNCGERIPVSSFVERIDKA